MDSFHSVKTELVQTQLALQMVSQINQVKTGLIGRSAHELRSPLSSLMSLLQLILNDLCENPQEEREFLGQAYEAAGRLMTLIDEMVKVSKLDYGTIALDLAPVELSALLGELQSLIHLPASNRNIRLKISWPENPTYGKADGQKLLQGLVLILDGAIRAQEGGEIQIEVKQEPAYAELLLKIPFSELWWREESNIPPLPNPLTLETIRDWSQSIHLSRGMQGQMVEILVEWMGGRLIYEEIEENSLSMTQLRFQFPACAPIGSD